MPFKMLFERLCDIIALVPFLPHNVLTKQGFQAYCDHYCTSKIGSKLTWVPFLLVTSMSNFLLALYIALGLHTLTILITLVRSTFRVGQDNFMFLDFTLWLGFVAMTVIEGVKGFNQTLANPILCTLLLSACVLSMIVSYPFALQIARKGMTDEEARSPVPEQVRKYCWAITLFWFILFVIMTASSWVAYGLFRNKPESTEYLVLSSIIPAVVPICGFLATAFFKWYGKKDTSVEADSSLNAV